MGDPSVMTILTVREDDLPCRSASYRGETCAPKNANLVDFPVRPGAEMPKIDGCSKQDYAVLFVLSKEV